MSAMSMKSTHPVPGAVLADGSRVADFIALLKPRVMSLVVFTGFVGLYLAPPPIHPLLASVAILCIALGAGASGAINMWYDRDIDSAMLRTCERPIPAGRMDPADALGFGIVTAVASVFIMGLAVNYVAAAALAGTILFYVFVYTVWLKRRTPQNIVIGGAAGAFPPVVGWAAASGDISLFPLILFAIIFMWTPPHFWALALFRCGDYAKVGVPMLPVVAGKRATKAQILLYTVLLVPLTLLPSVLGFSGLLYGAVAALLGAFFLYFALKVWRARGAAGNKAAKRLFGFSILYLFILFAALVADKMLTGSLA